MDQYWDCENWSPSIKFDLLWTRPSREEVEEYRAELIKITKMIKLLPYMVRLWRVRSNVLMLLGFPELAAADAHKGMMLTKDAFDYESELGERARLCMSLELLRCSQTNAHMHQEGGLHCEITTADTAEELQNCIEQSLMFEREKLLKSFDMMIKALYALQSFADLFTTCQEAIKLYPSNDIFRQTLDDSLSLFQELVEMLKGQDTPWVEIKWVSRVGAIHLNNYPWLTEEYSNTRTQAVIDEANVQLETLSDCLQIQPSTLPWSTLQNNTTLSYGMFATKDVQTGHIILNAAHSYGVSLEQSTTQCYNCYKSLISREEIYSKECCPEKRYCSLICQQVAETSYHRILCGKNFEGIVDRAQRAWGGNREEPHLSPLIGWDDRVTCGYPDEHFEAGLNEYITLLLARVLAVCVQAGGHPLLHPDVAQWMPFNKTDFSHGWTLNSMVVGPTEALQILGIDVFADERFDSWVINTMMARIINNMVPAGGPVPGGSVLPWLSWFNHSRVYNSVVVREGVNIGATIKIESTTNINKGDEVFIDTSPLDVEEEQAREGEAIGATTNIESTTDINKDDEVFVDISPLDFKEKQGESG
ncbi:wd and tetratricopeptide repeat protein [Drepanopeziza brunnea f. sp. 'multigermtubi' MB_m1]|uniref:Histone-lysine N-methyltransferase SET5 n=1 Tax=Marssonina brunnea f. sp. multigermtubi (strain MB_m1) TaxID=1072389 RepID=K1WC98_MARBU|nr:wd and tetratricopeptide repeat protein [Drepanopeziza brunnea f. sp. 'multigermtubi' MB_m1]EKD15000.1 wd and tetratricopeptide repeat protein [Drepanopeziza brunnea f. sp. 'multigermtubi' MB_m1]